MKKTNVSIALLFAAFLLMQSSYVCAQSGLPDGIRLYKSGSYDEALIALGGAVERNPQCPLAYYYAARIRITREQYSRAVQNLGAALRDSSGFTDARGTLAYALLKNGRDKDALESWRQFINAVAPADVAAWADVNKIMLPDTFASEYAAYRKNRQSTVPVPPLTASHTSDSLRATALKDSAHAAYGDTLAKSDSTATADSARTASGRDSLALAAADTLGGTNIADIEKRIRAGIRDGVYGISLALGILLLGGLILWFSRRRRSNKKENRNFNEQVARMVDDRDFELGEEQAIKEFEAKKRELARELRGLSGLGAKDEELSRPATEERGRVIYEKPEEPEEEYAEYAPQSSEAEEETEERWTDPLKPAWSQDNRRGERRSGERRSGERRSLESHSGKPPITEEIKALVSRLYREGHTPDDIARTADLTKSEVNLILAVREHHMEGLIRDIAAEEDARPDRDSLVRAVADLLDEGADAREIARRLSISTSEVRLASMMIAKKRR